MSTQLIKKLEEKYELKFNERLRNFFLKEVKKFNNKQVDRLEGPTGEFSNFELEFTDEDFLNMAWDHMSDGGSEIPEDPRIVPFSKLGNDGASFFIAVNNDDENCPIYIWDEGEASQIFESLDEFLEAVDSSSSDEEE